MNNEPLYIYMYLFKVCLKTTCLAKGKGQSDPENSRLVKWKKWEKTSNRLGEGVLISTSLYLCI